MKIAWFSPLYGHDTNEPKFDSTSRAAYTTFHLVPALYKHFAVDLFYAGPQSRVVLDGGVEAPAYNYLNAALMAERTPYDLYVYQVEDTANSGWIRHHLGLKPGIVWFHDILFQNRGPDPLSHSPWTHVIEALRGQDITLPEEDVWPETNDPYPWRETLLALGTIFLSPWAHGEYRRRVAGRRGLVQAIVGDQCNTPSTTLRYPVISNTNKSNSKGIGILGGANSEDRVTKILSALEPGQVVNWFVRTGEQAQVERLLQLYPKDTIAVQLYDSPSEFRSRLASVGMIFMLHYSLYGSLSPWLEIAGEAGVVCVISDYGLAEYLPDSSVLKVPVGTEELWYLKEIVKEWQGANIRAPGNGKDIPSHYDPMRELAQEFALFVQDHMGVWEQGAAAWERMEEWSRQWVNHALIMTKEIHA
jgi:hypothetical protein